MLADLPPYVVINDETIAIEKREALRRPSLPISFPLSTQDKEMLDVLEKKFDEEEACAGLAAPQIGFNKQATVFTFFGENSEKKMVWLNPDYAPIGKALETDVEGCFSVRDLMGPVPRYAKIRYVAYSPTGKKITGTAEGYAARVIQHEIDHLKGRLFIDLVDPHLLKTKEEYLKERAAADLAAEKTEKESTHE